MANKITQTGSPKDFVIRNDDFLLVAYADLQHVEPIIFQAVNGLGEDGIEQPPEDGNLYADINEYAKMDNRPIWSLLYDIGSTQKVGRVLMKASEEFWKESYRVCKNRNGRRNLSGIQSV